MALFAYETAPIGKSEEGLVAGAIAAYLEKVDKTVNAVVLAEMTQAFRKAMIKQLMSEREDRAGYESTTLYSGPCARKSFLTYAGHECEPVKARTVLKFTLGDVVELAVLAIAKLAGCNIGGNNVDLSIAGGDGKAVPVHPDGLLQIGHPCTELINIEVKSCDSHTFDRWLVQGGPDDSWGYLTQASVEVQAWREHGYTVNRSLFVGVSTGSRIGSVAEWSVPFDPALVEAWHERRWQVQLGLPNVPFEAEAETKFFKGQAVPTEVHQKVHRKLDKNGKHYGYDVETGRKILPMYCSYCDFKFTGGCWPGLVQEMKGDAPVFVVPVPVPNFAVGNYPKKLGDRSEGI